METNVSLSEAVLLHPNAHRLAVVDSTGYLLRHAIFCSRTLHYEIGFQFLAWSWNRRLQARNTAVCVTVVTGASSRDPTFPH